MQPETTTLQRIGRSAVHRGVQQRLDSPSTLISPGRRASMPLPGFNDTLGAKTLPEAPEIELPMKRRRHSVELLPLHDDASLEISVGRASLAD